MEIPIIDIFAGPGGLGEGFSAYLTPQKKRPFNIVLSIEKDTYAHQTLTLRSFFRQFPPGNAPSEYYEFVKGQITLNELYLKWPQQAQKAKQEAWLADLGESKNSVSNRIVDEKIRSGLNGQKNWLLIGGPPCQAYSVVGRSRRQEKILDEKKDERVGLYKQYLRILAIHNPSVFVMENVKGLLSAKTEDSRVFPRIINDLKDPVNAYLSEYRTNGVKLDCPGYRIYSLVKKPSAFDLHGNPVFLHKDFVIQSENYGIPQTRHRIILLGIRNDINFYPDTLEPRTEIPLSSILAGLPKIRSSISKSEDGDEIWKATIKQIMGKDFFASVDERLKQLIIKHIDKITIPHKKTGQEYIAFKRISSAYRPEWYTDEKLEGISNHSSRGHMISDLHRYFFASCFAKQKKRSPRLKEFPQELLPAHKNVSSGIEGKKFTDRFRVQLWNRPCKTITSHISQDGHYYIHPDPTQCRSLTVREAARIQTFPDNYYFCGPRTSQFIQVGNAVPPLLANQIAEIVSSVFNNVKRKDERLKTEESVTMVKL